MTDEKDIFTNFSKRLIEDNYKIQKEKDDAEYLKCIEDLEDITWYKEKYPKGKGIYDPVFDDPDETFETEEEITKELHYKDNE